MANANEFTDRCGNCAFARPTVVDSDRVECVLGGQVSLPRSKRHQPCICYRPSVKEMRRRNPDPQPQKPTKGRPRKEIPHTILWNEDMDEQLIELFSSSLNTIADIAKRMGMTKKDITNRVNDLGLERKSRGHASKAKSIFHDGNNLPPSEQKYPRMKCCKGLCCKYKEQCAHYAHWLEMGKPQFDTINSVGTCINSPYKGVYHTETRYAYREFISLDGKSHEPEQITFTEIL